MFSTPWSRLQTEENQPLLRPMASNTVGSFCLVAILSSLILAWCVLDQWNRDVSDSLFQIGDMRAVSAEFIETPLGVEVVPNVTSPFGAFTFPLTLAFCEFLLMGMLFMGLYLSLFRERTPFPLCLTSDGRWPALVLTHAFSVFFLQALMLPKQALSLGLFAASRAVEIPMAAAFRLPICKEMGGRKTWSTVLMATAAACIIYFAYTQVSGCLCVWSGNGVMLAGFAFWFVYLLVLALPAANLVCQEGVMALHEVHPILMLGLQNLFASAIFLPVLILASAMGWEDVMAGMKMIIGVHEVTLLVGWLCLQMALISIVSVAVIKLTDSFWAVALQALRVLWWWLQQLWMFYNSAPMGHALMSTSCPHASMWSFVILSGFCLTAAAVYSDRKAQENAQTKPTGSSNPKSEV